MNMYSKGLWSENRLKFLAGNMHLNYLIDAYAANVPSTFLMSKTLVAGGFSAPLWNIFVKQDVKVLKINCM